MVHDPHAPFANLLQQLVGTDLGAGLFDEGGKSRVAATPVGERFEKALRARRAAAEDAATSVPKSRIVTADLLQVSLPRIRRLDLRCRCRKIAFSSCCRSFMAIPFRCGKTTLYCQCAIAKPLWRISGKFGNILVESRLTATYAASHRTFDAQPRSGVSPIRVGSCARNAEDTQRLPRCVSPAKNRILTNSAAC